jgi:hypothetical protein
MIIWSIVYMQMCTDWSRTMFLKVVFTSDHPCGISSDINKLFSCSLFIFLYSIIANPINTMFMHFTSILCHCLISERPAKKGKYAQFLCLIFIYFTKLKSIFILNFMQNHISKTLIKQKWKGYVVRARARLGCALAGGAKSSLVGAVHTGWCFAGCFPANS